MKRLNFSVVIAVLLLGFTVAGQDPTAAKGSLAGPGSVRQITLDEAKSLAAQKRGDNPMVKLAKLAADVAEYKRKQAQADYFPKIGSTFANMHFNKFMGQELQLARRTVGVPLMNKDFTLFATTVTQPVTPLLKVREAVKIMRADETLAKAKATAAEQSLSASVEKAYFDLLLTQKQQIISAATVRALDKRLQVASVSGADLAGMSDQETEVLEITKRSLELRSKEVELTAALNDLIGLPADTTLELALPITPIPPGPEVTIGEATARAETLNLAVIEAEQNVVKARAAKKLSQLEYVPDVAVIGGYSYQNALPLLPNDFSFVGVMATFNVFDFGKREHLIKERKTTLEMAETGLVLAKAAAAAQVKTSFYEVEKTRKILEITRRIVAAQPTTMVSYGSDAFVKRANAETEMIEAELAYRKAVAELKRLTGE